MSRTLNIQAGGLKSRKKIRPFGVAAARKNLEQASREGRASDETGANRSRRPSSLALNACRSAAWVERSVGSILVVRGGVTAMIRWRLPGVIETAVASRFDDGPLRGLLAGPTTRSIKNAETNIQGQLHLHKFDHHLELKI